MNAYSLSSPLIHRAKRIGYLLWLAILAGTLIGPISTEAQTIRRISAPGKFYVDDKDSNGVIYNYAVYTISNNTGVNIPSTYVALTNIYPTNRIQLSPTDNGVRPLGALAPGQTKLAAFYLKGPSFTGNSDTLLNLTNEVHSIQVWAGAPVVGTLLSASNHSYTNIIFLIEAAANKITVITNLNPLAILGSEVTLVIAGDTGTIGGDNSITFSPGVLGSWRPDAYQLINTVVRFSQNPTYTNRLYFDPSISGFTNHSGQTYTNTFLFRAVRVTGTNLPISPFAFVDSGSGTKHTALSSLISAGGSNQIYSASNLMSIVSHSVTPSSLLAPGGLVTYSVTFSNGFFLPLDLDEILDDLPGFPGNVTYVPGSATYNSLSISNPSISGQTLRWAQPFTIPGNGTGTLVFQAIAPLPAGDYTNRVRGVLGNEQIDLTVNTADNAPATSVFTVIPVSDLGLSKSGPATTPAAGNFNYTLAVTNLGPSPASGITVTDALPAAVTFVSATSGGFFSGGNVIWTNLNVAASNSAPVTVTVTAPPEGTSFTNLASVSGPALDPNSTNNVTPGVFTSVTPVADLELIKSAPAVVPNNLNFNYTLLVTNHGPSAATNVAVTDTLPPNVTFVSASNGGFLSGGNVLWTNLGALAANTGITLTLTVTAPAGGGTTNTASVVSPTSDPNGGNNSTPPVVSTVGNVSPTTVDDTASGPRNTPVSVDVLANDSDANGDPLALIGVTQTNGTASINGANVDFSAATNFLGTVVLTYTVIDGQGGTNTGLFTINITNRPPVALDDAALVTNGVPRQLFPLVNDSDPDGDNLTITNASASNGTVTINPGGTNLTFTATNLFNGSVTYTIVDGFGGTATAVVAIIGNNIAPTAFNNLGLSLPEDTSTNLVYNATDDGTNLIFAILDVPTNGVISAFDANAGTATYTPNTNYFGPDSFTFTVFDGQLYATGLVSLIVTPVNDAPVATDLGVVTVEDVATNLVLTASDVDSTNLTFAILTAPTNGGLSLLDTNTGAVTYTPNTNYNGPDSIIFTVFDGSLYATGTVSITVTSVDDAPVLLDDLVTMNEDGTNTIPVLVNDSDPDGDPLIIVSVSATNGVADVVGTNVVYTPVPDFSGTNVLTYCVSDGAATNCATITVVVLPVNDAPVANNQGIAITEDNSTNLVLTASDVDNANLAFAIVVGPANGSLDTLNTNTGAVTYSPNTNYVGSDSITFTVFDGSLYATGTVSITVTPINDVPVANSQSVTNLEDTLLSITLTGSDVDGPVTNFVLVSLPVHGTLSGSGANLTYTPTNNYNGPDAFTFAVNDGSLTSAVATVSIMVLPVNDAPIANDDGYSTPKNIPLNISAPGILANDTDVEGDVLTAALVANVAHGTLSLSTNGGFTYTPSNNYVGPDSFTYQASDSLSNSVVATVNLNITLTNVAPVAVNDSFTMTEDSTNTIPVLVNDSDPDGDTLTIGSVVTTNGTATLMGTNVVYTPAPDFFGTNEMTYCVTDGAITNCATITVVVLPVNDAPVANGQSVTTPEDTSTNLVLTASDVDSTNLTFAIVSGPASGTLGTLNTNTGAVAYSPNTNYVGGDSFTFTVFDGSLYATGAVSIAVTPINDAPVANSQSVTNLEDAALPITLTGSDVDGPVTNFVLVSLPTHGALSGSGANLTYTPTNNYNGPDSFTFTVNDGSLTSTVATVSVLLLPVNDPPSLINDFVVMTEDGTNSIPVLANDGDPDGDPLILVSVTSSNGTATVVGTNVVFTPAPNYTGTNLLTYFATDGTVTNSAAITVVVTPFNDAPTVNDLIVTIPEDSTLSTNVMGNDVDGDALTYGIVFKSPTSLLTLNTGTGEFDYTPPANDTSTNLVLLSVFDGSLYATSTVQVIITPANDAPVANNQSATIPEDISTNLVLTASDVDNTNLLFAILSGPSNGFLGALNASSGAVAYTPVTNYAGSDGFTFTVYDGAFYATGAVSLTVTAVNDVPIANSQSVTNYENSPIGITLTGSDVDGPVTNFFLVSLPLHGTLSGTGANRTYTPTNNHDGPDSFTFAVNDGSRTSAVATVSITVLPVADVAVFKSGPTNVAPAQNFNYSIAVTNLGPSGASNVVVADSLPANLTFISASGGGVLSNGIVRWTLSALLENTGTNFTLTVTAPTNGLFTNFIASTATTFDANPANNNGSAAGSSVSSTVVPVQFGIRQTGNTFNPQTGLYEQLVSVTNLSGSTVAAFRVLVGDIRSTNGTPRTNVWLWNATGTNVDSRPFVQWNSPLDPGNSATVRLEFHNPTRVPFTNSIEVEVTLPTPAAASASTGTNAVAIDRVFVDNRESGNPRFVIEWLSIPGRNYTVIYSDDNMLTWRAATPTVTASATRTQWYDDGPPKTATKPIAVSSRLYRVILNP
jgi:uncharacterized repeat protein (TIGR01451 family)